MGRARSILCPYCFNRYSTSLAAFRCTSTDDARCARVADEALGRLRGTDAPLMGRVLVRQARMGQAHTVKQGQPVRCDCGSPTRPVCPHCHHDLPQRFADAASRSMALIGTRLSGKSHFIAVAIHELEHRVGPQFQGSLMLLDDATRARIAALTPRLYDSGVALDATMSARQNGAVREPLVSRLTLGQGRQATQSNLVFFDAAGEDLQSLDVLEREARYITQSDGLILLIDPLQIPAVRDEFADVTDLPPPIDPYTMLGRISGLLREARAVPAKRQIEVPIALAVSKLDMLRPLLPDTHPVYSLAPHAGRFDAQAARSISAALRADLAGWIGEHFDSFVRSEFKTFSYFGLSALGENPVGGHLRNGVSPHRVEDPILWMLDTWNAIPRG